MRHVAEQSNVRIAAASAIIFAFANMIGGLASVAQETGEPDQPAAIPIVLVMGAGGTPEYEQQFAEWVDRWLVVAERCEATVTQVGRGESESNDRDRLKSTIEQLELESPVPVWIVLIGHGTYANTVAKFNLRGPDVSAAQLADWLKPLKRTVVVVDCASSSGPFINRLSGPNRVIVTATKSGIEQNFSRFGKYFAEAVGSAESDLDHDDEVSVHEAFLKASAGVRQFYDAEARISTEHALIDDNGDGKGTPATMFRGTRPIAKAKDGSELDGKRASRVTLRLSENRLTLTSEELARRDEIEQQLDQLRGQKDELDQSQYEDQLTALLIEMAKLYQTAESRVAE